MAEKLESTQRQLINESFKAPPTQAMADISNAFGELANFTITKAGSIASDIAGEKAGRAGEKAASEGETRKLAPGLTKATRRFNEAFLSTQASLAALSGSKLLDDHLRDESAPGKLNSSSLGTYSELAESSIAGTLSDIDEAIRPAVAFKLQQHLFRNQGKLSDLVQGFNLNQLDENFNEILTDNYKKLRESVMGSDQEGASEALLDINETVNNRKELNLLNETEAQGILDKTDEIILFSDFDRQHLQSRIDNSEEAFLEKLAGNKPGNVTFGQWDKIGSNALARKKQEDGLVNKQRGLSGAKWEQKFATGQIQTLEDLEPAKDDLSATEYTKLETKFLTQQSKESKEMLDILEFENNNANSPFKASQSSTATKNAAYNLRLDAALESKREILDDPNANLTMLDKAQVASVYNTPIPEFNLDLQYPLLTEGVDGATMSQSLEAYKFLAGDLSNLERLNVLDMDRDAEKIARSALNKKERGGATVEDAMLKAQEAILKADDLTHEARMEAYKDRFGGAKAKQVAVQMKKDLAIPKKGNEEIFVAYENLLRTNSATMESVDEAVEFTKREMVNKVGFSRYGPDKETAMFNPPEMMVPFIENGHWYDNQYVLAHDQIAKDYEFAAQAKLDLDANTLSFNALQTELVNLSEEGLSRDDDKVITLVEQGRELSKLIKAGQFNPAVTVEWALDPLPERISQEELLNAPILKAREIGKIDVLDPLAPLKLAKAQFKGRPKKLLKIGGVARETFGLTDASSTSRDNGKYTMGLYYKDDFGITQSVPHPFNERGVAEFATKQFDEFLPGVSAEMSDKTIKEVSKKEAERLFQSENPRRVIDGLFVSKARVEREIQHREFLEEKIPQIEERKKSQRDKARGK